jgi:hypothetical protein
MLVLGNILSEWELKVGKDTLRMRMETAADATQTNNGGDVRVGGAIAGANDHK